MSRSQTTPIGAEDGEGRGRALHSRDESRLIRDESRRIPEYIGESRSEEVPIVEYIGICRSQARLRRDPPSTRRGCLAQRVEGRAEADGPRARSRRNIGLLLRAVRSRPRRSHSHRRGVSLARVHRVVRHRRFGDTRRNIGDFLSSRVRKFDDISLMRTAGETRHRRRQRVDTGTNGNDNGPGRTRYVTEFTNGSTK